MGEEERQSAGGYVKLESEIEQLVAPRELYGLTEDEVKIVENRP